MAEGLFSTPAPLSGLLARVVLERGIDHPDGLTYSVPASLADIQIGERIRAPLGRADRLAEGYIIDIFPADQAQHAAPGLDPARIKPIAARAGRTPGAAAGRLPPPLLRLALWISRYYCCPIGMAIAAMVPASVKRQTGGTARTLLQRTPTAPDASAIAALTPSARAAWLAAAALPDDAFPIEPRALAGRLDLRTAAPINRLIRAGLLTEVTRPTVRTRADGAWLAAAEAYGAPPPTLTPAQRAAVDAVTASLTGFRSFLLHGVTGSGKTEVYLHAIERVLRAGRAAIVLVPEISLTPQTAGRFLSRFAADDPRTVAVLHSGLSQSRRHAAWAAAAAGEARVIVGARSAVFAPTAAPLGIIVVDEEHDPSYKQDQLPRYHARDVALRRAQIEGCPVLLASATPSLESWLNALPRAGGGAERHTLLTLPQRVAGGRLPRITVLNMPDEDRLLPPKERRTRAIGPTLEREIRATLAGSGRIILLLNRRGYASYVCCADATCGWYLTCRHCDVTAVYHRRGHQDSPLPAAGVVRCHHCLAEQKLPAACPACGKKVNTFGFGTQRVEDELARLFPDLAAGGAVIRLDRDAVRGAADFFEALERFRAGGARLLLGTQMVAKGLDFPDVELIGVLNADTALNLPDFRCEERTFHLVSQVAGRAGRSAASSAAARVLVQTWNPAAASIRAAAAHDFQGFAQHELSLRRETGLPPVGRMARIVCRDTDPARAENRAHDIARAARSANDQALRTRGPMACPIARIGDHYRFAVELLAPDAARVQAALTRLRAQGLVRSDAHTAVDVDPLSLL